MLPGEQGDGGLKSVLGGPAGAVAFAGEIVEDELGHGERGYSNETGIVLKGVDHFLEERWLLYLRDDCHPMLINPIQRAESFRRLCTTTLE